MDSMLFSSDFFLFCNVTPAVYYQRYFISLCYIFFATFQQKAMHTSIEKGKNSWMKELINGRVMKVKKLTYIKISNSRDFSFKLLNHEGSFIQ